MPRDTLSPQLRQPRSGGGMSGILDCAFRSWLPGFGDPTPAGWVTVAAYLVAAALAFRMAALRTRPPQRTAERAFWALAGLGLVFLAVNKQLDLQSLMTAAGRCAARMQGWYGARRPVQVAVILGLVAAAGLVGLLTLALLWRSLGRTLPAILGLAAITAFVLVRAVGFHHVDALIGMRVGGFRLNWMFELGAIALFCAGVLWATRHRAPPERR